MTLTIGQVCFGGALTFIAAVVFVFRREIWKCLEDDWDTLCDCYRHGWWY